MNYSIRYKNIQLLSYLGVSVMMKCSVEEQVKNLDFLAKRGKVIEVGHYHQLNNQNFGGLNLSVAFQSN